ncbi:MAG TPA: NAD(P)-dependent alcohol dehydrogenase [Vicinamibacterales bacterium]|nr:NAD(P)-dependent alcohol dehydrogenase [Vicinamibacterales bacterium]
MRAWIVPKGCATLDQLRLVERTSPVPGAREVVVRVRATSLNYRDHAVVVGQYFGGAVTRDLIPLSDGAGEVIAVGSAVTRFKPGARVMATFFQPGPQPAALGSPLDGMLAEQVVLNEDGVVSIPDHLSFEEAACLPCAAVTAWHALYHAGRPIKAGDTVLVLGTGGVSIAALQFAKATGARVIATSSSDEKAARAIALGASDVVNYERTPEWEQEVRKLTSGRGVDCVVEIGGAGTLARSIRSLARGGKIGLIGFLAGREGDTNPAPLMMVGGSLHGIFVGDREMFEEMNRAIAVNRLTPVIDRVFPFDSVPAAYQHQAGRGFVGKIVITLRP